MTLRSTGSDVNRAAELPLFDDAEFGGGVKALPVAGGEGEDLLR